MAGLFLGWGPVLPFLAAIGCTALLIATFKKKNLENAWMLVVCLLALGSFLVVSFVFSDDPNYLGYQHFSTLIRFSHTAIPAYFVAAPVAFELLLRKRKYVLPTIAIMLLTLAAIPLYEGYASSNLGLPQNPFSLDYRTPGIILRDYVTSVRSGNQFVVMGFSQNSWWWTPGTAWMQNVTFFPYLTYQEFAAHRWSTFYVFGDGDGQMYCELHAVIPHGVSLGVYQLVGQHVVLNQSGYSMVKVNLHWPNG